MKYFHITQNKNIQDIPKLVHWRDKFTYENYRKETFYTLKKRTLINIESNENIFFVDLITSPFIIFSKKMRNTISLYNNIIKYKELVLLDIDNSFNEHYFLGMLPVAECLTEKSEFNLDKSICKRIVINNKSIKNKSIFLLGGVKSDYLILRMDLMESLLRRDVQGINIVEVEVEFEER